MFPSIPVILGQILGFSAHHLEFHVKRQKRTKIQKNRNVNCLGFLTKKISINSAIFHQKLQPSPAVSTAARVKNSQRSTLPCRGKEKSRQAMNRTASDHWLHMSTPGTRAPAPDDRDDRGDVCAPLDERRIHFGRMFLFRDLDLKKTHEETMMKLL